MSDTGTSQFPPHILRCTPCCTGKQHVLHVLVIYVLVVATSVCWLHTGWWCGAAMPMPRLTATLKANYDIYNPNLKPKP